MQDRDRGMGVRSGRLGLFAEQEGFRGKVGVCVPAETEHGNGAW